MYYALVTIAYALVNKYQALLTAYMYKAVDKYCPVEHVQSDEVIHTSVRRYNVLYVPDTADRGQ